MLTHVDVFYRWQNATAKKVYLFKSDIRSNIKLFSADTISVAIAAALAVILATGSYLSTIELIAVPQFAFASIMLTMPILIAAGYYRKHRHSATIPGLLALLPGSAIAVIVCLIMARGTRWLSELPLTTFPIMFLIMLTFLVGTRVTALTRETMRRNRQQAAVMLPEGMPAILVGLGATSDLFMRAVHQGMTPYKLVGIVNDSMDSGGAGLLFHSVPILGSIRDPHAIITRLMNAEQLPRFLLLAETATHPDSEGLTTLCNWAEARGIKVRSLPDLITAQPAPGTGSDVALIDPEDVLTRPQQSVELQLLRSTYRGQRVLVTGAGGSIGSELVRQLASLDPAELVLVENCEFNAYQVDRLLALHFPDVPRTLHLCCIRDRVHLQSVFERHRPDLVFNAAALKHVPLVERNPCEGVLTNVIGTRNVCDAARSVGVRAFVQVSTDKAVNSTNIMGATKRVAEFYCQAQDLITRDLGCSTRYFAVRFGNVLGSSGSLIPLFQEQIIRGGPLTVTHPDMERYFMTIREAVELTLLAAAQGLKSNNEDNGRIFVLDMGQPVRIVDLAERMIRMAGKEPGRDIEIKFIGMRPGEKLFEELFDREEVIQPAGFAGVSCAIPNPVPIPRLRAALLQLERSAGDRDENAVRRGLADLVPGFAGETRLPGELVHSIPPPRAETALSFRTLPPTAFPEVRHRKAFA
ncbi:MAG: polysaccharide biosynthesis protein [Paracoccus sp. (in: a-proteobacteria)]